MIVVWRLDRLEGNLGVSRLYCWSGHEGRRKKLTLFLVCGKPPACVGHRRNAVMETRNSGLNLYDSRLWDNVGGLSEDEFVAHAELSEWQAERTPDKIDGQRAKLS